MDNADIDRANQRLLDELYDFKKRNSELEEEVKRLRLQERKYREIVQSANSIIMRMDTKGNITFFNEYAQRFFGYPEKEIIGKNVLGTIVPQTDAAGKDLVEMIINITRSPQDHSVNENENIRRDGAKVRILWTNKAIVAESGAISEILCIGNDVTNLKTHLK